MFDQPVNWGDREQKFFLKVLFYAVFQNFSIFSEIMYIFITKKWYHRFPYFHLISALKITKSVVFSNFCHLKAYLFFVVFMNLFFCIQNILQAVVNILRELLFRISTWMAVNRKKSSKSTILNVLVIIRKFKCHQKISSVRFAGNDMSNYGLILNTADSRKK
jgi:hypothetical protein